MLRFSSLTFAIVTFLSLGPFPWIVNSKSLSVQDLEGPNGLQVESRDVSTVSGVDKEQETFETQDQLNKRALLKYGAMQDTWNSESSKNWDMPKLNDEGKLEHDIEPPYSFNSNDGVNTGDQIYYTYTTTSSYSSWKLFYLMILVPILICLRCCRYCSKTNETSQPTTTTILTVASTRVIQLPSQQRQQQGEQPNCGDNVHLINPGNNGDSDSHLRRDTGTSKEDEFDNDGLPSYNEVMGGQKV